MSVIAVIRNHNEIRKIIACLERQAPFRHMYLQTIGVDPQHQGKGFADKLIKPMLNRLDEERLPCYLDTLDAKNVGIYEHLGFKLVNESIIPGTELTCWALISSA